MKLATITEAPEFAIMSGIVDDTDSVSTLSGQEWADAAFSVIALTQAAAKGESIKAESFGALRAQNVSLSDQRDALFAQCEIAARALSNGNPDFNFIGLVNPKNIVATTLQGVAATAKARFKAHAADFAVRFGA